MFVVLRIILRSVVQCDLDFAETDTSKIEWCFGLDRNGPVEGIIQVDLDKVLRTFKISSEEAEKPLWGIGSLLGFRAGVFKNRSTVLLLSNDLKFKGSNHFFALRDGGIVCCGAHCSIFVADCDIDRTASRRRCGRSWVASPFGWTLSVGARCCRG